MSARAAWVDGSFVAEGAGAISPFDEGFLRGMGVFETLRSVGGAFPTLADHLLRLRWCALHLGFEPGLHAPEQVEALARELLARAGVAEGVLRVTCTRGSGAGPVRCLTVSELPPGLEELRQRGAAVVLSPFRRDASDPTTGLKLTGYTFHVLAREEATARGADEAVLLAREGWVQEGAWSNVFFLRGGVVHTPTITRAFLPGVTRALVLQSLRASGLRCVEGTYRSDDLAGAEAVFLTNGVWEVMPVARVEGRSGLPVAPVLELQRRFRDGLARRLQAGAARTIGSGDMIRTPNPPL